MIAPVAPTPINPASLLKEIRDELAKEASDDGRRVLKNVITIVERYDEQWQQTEGRRKEESARVIRRMKSEGKKTGGGMPYGYKLDENGVDLCEVPDEQHVIKAARLYYARGLSLRGVAEQLKADGVFPREEQEDDRFHPVQISRMLDEESRRVRERSKAVSKANAVTMPRASHPARPRSAPKPAPRRSRR